MSSLVPELAAVLGTVRRPGDFFASGTAELLAPMMEVDGVGPIALPLLPVQAEQLIAVAERAPMGAARRPWSIRRCGGPGRSTRSGSISAAGIGRKRWKGSAPARPGGGGGAGAGGGGVLKGR